MVADVNIIIEKMRPEHLPAVMMVQAMAYHEIEPEDLPVMARKLELSPENCFISLVNREVKGYILAHPWLKGQIPELHIRIEKLPPESDSMYVHDLAVASEVRGQHAAVALFTAMRKTAIAAGFRQSHLVAIQSSCRFWEKMGYKPVNNTTLQEKLNSYPPGAIVMQQG